MNHATDQVVLGIVQAAQQYLAVLYDGQPLGGRLQPFRMRITTLACQLAADDADGNKQPSELRGDPGAPRTVNDDTRDPHSSSSPAITQALITALQPYLPYLQHLSTCDTRNKGQRWEPHYKRDNRRPEGWFGAWIPDASVDPPCNCGLAALAFAEKG